MNIHRDQAILSGAPFAAAWTAAMLLAVLIALAAVPGAARAAGEGAAGAPDARLRVVASFSILADLVHQVGGDDIRLSVIVGPLSDPHTFEPRPQDAQRLGQAQVLVVNGLGFESWLPRLQAASGFHGLKIVASADVMPRVLRNADDAGGHAAEAGSGHAHGAGDVDPHAWQDLSNGILYVHRIAQGLAQADPRHAADYRRRAAAYAEQLRSADTAWRKALAGVPPERRILVTTHDAFGYFAAAYGIQVQSLLGFSDEAEPSARAIARLVRQIRAQHVSAIFLEQGVSTHLLRRVAAEAGVQVGGQLFADTLNRPGQPPSTYLEMFHWNTQRLLQAFQADPGP